MKKKIHIQLFSIHGLLRANNLEMGRDADTGGQIKYVVELADYLSKHESVDRVDLFTRLVADKSVSGDYSVPVEEVNEKFRIIRIQCGGRKYIRKELLWNHLDEFVDKTIKFIKQQNLIPDIVHGHYADAGYVAMNLSNFFGVPMVFTGHSLGRSKLDKLLKEGLREDDIIKRYKINTRIDVEEEVLLNADCVITSTRQEIDVQYGQYRNGKYPKFSVVPPGLDIEKFYPYYHSITSEGSRSEVEIMANASVLKELNRFFLHPDRPIILALCRPDKRKNISGLITAYGEDRELQAMANLAVFAGIRKDISDKEDNERDVLTEMLLLMDKYDLYGRMAIPKKHDFELEVPELYRIVAAGGGVFVNPALVEPFGLTLIEASSCGLPIIATNDGGPLDIMKNCQNGILVDVADTKNISRAIKKIITDEELWEKYSKNGIINVREHYTWGAHTDKYISEIKKILPEKIDEFRLDIADRAVGKRLTAVNYFLITDIDFTLIGDENPDLPELIELLNRNNEKLGFGVATGRSVDSAIDHLSKYSIPVPDVLISSVGSEIYYGKQRLYDKGWAAHISHKWNRGNIVKMLSELDFLEYQEEEAQRPFKVSYNMKPGKDRLAEIHRILQKNRCQYNLIYSHDSFLDILPYRASKGKAIRYLCYKWGINIEDVIVSGDSGNDEEMLRGEPLAIVVGNYSPELEFLRGFKNIYFAERHYAGGILEGLEYYNFTEKLKDEK